MIKPTYEISASLLGLIKRVAVLTAELKAAPVAEVVEMELRDRAQSLSSHTSTRIEGNALSLTAVRGLLKSRPANLADSEREVLNYNRALESLEDRSGPVDLQHILELHAMVMDGLMESYHCGRFREEPVVINNPATGDPVYLAPGHEDVHPLMVELLEWVEQNVEKHDPVIVAGVFHRQFVIIHPFIDGNGRTCRLATTAILRRAGLDTSRMFSFENYYARNVTRYFKQVGLEGDYYEIRDRVDHTRWLEYFAEGIVDELLRVKGELESVSASPDTTLKPHEKRLLDHIRAHGFITDRDYSRLTDRAKATRALDFKRLIELGLIERHGRGRSTHYKLRS